VFTILLSGWITNLLVLEAAPNLAAPDVPIAAEARRPCLSRSHFPHGVPADGSRPHSASSSSSSTRGDIRLGELWHGGFLEGSVVHAVRSLWVNIRPQIEPRRLLRDACQLQECKSQACARAREGPTDSSSPAESSLPWSGTVGAGLQW
jgi:hypothetical protein